jgi:thiamine biosynthesis lipoprotein ApbE
MNKLLLRLGVAGVVAAGTVWVVRKYQANKDQTEELLQQRVAQFTEALQQGVVQVTKQASDLVEKVQVHFDVAMTQLANTWLGEPVDNGEPTPDEEKPADQYTNSDPLLDDGGTRNDAA